MKTKLSVFFLSLLFCWGLTSASVNADQIYYQDFGTGGWASGSSNIPDFSNLFGNNHDMGVDSINSIADPDDNLYAWVRDDAAIYLLIDTTDYENITVNFSWCTNNTEYNYEWLFGYGWDGTDNGPEKANNWNNKRDDFIELASITQEDSWIEESFELDSNADSNEQFFVAFFLNGGNYDYGLLDWIEVQGDLITMMSTPNISTLNISTTLTSAIPNPEPTTILLFGIGLLGLANISRKNR